jgi:hypothetical protein
MAMANGFGFACDGRVWIQHDGDRVLTE